MSYTKSNSVQVVMKDLPEHPQCPHGPTLLFVRNEERFFACSAYRNRKYCKFFMLEKDRKKRKVSKSSQPSVRNKIFDHENVFNEFIKLKFAQQDDRCYCHSCSVLFNSSKDSKHDDHDVIRDLSLESLFYPTKFLKPLEDNKKEAQYLFSDESVNVISQILIENNFRYVLCIGVPRIHEYIKNYCHDKNITSILLDIDLRHYSFNGPHEFCYYNMFNHHFFDGDTIKNDVYLDFLGRSREDNVCIIMDPPFGGRIEPLSNTLRQISKEFCHLKGRKAEILLKTIFVMPYFMEPHIKNHISELNMSDYQVSYNNHSDFQNGSKNTNGSPIRVFTNISLEKFKLPANEGYTFCKDCKKWIGSWNKHCFKCNNCVSKNGTTYVHCDKCNRCCKSSWKHCNKCNRCSLKEHECRNLIYNQTCFHCNVLGHKKSDCPQLKENDIF